MTARTRALVTGATGFVGSHLAKGLAERGFEVRALVRETSRTDALTAAGVTLATGGLEERALAAALHDVDVVFHLAATTRALSAEAYERINGGGTALVARAALRANRQPRLVYLSSLAAAGPSRDGRPVDRDTPPHPVTAYGRGKLAGERACAEAGEQGLGAVIVRAPAVYGPGDRDILRFFRFAMRGIVPLPAGGPRRVQMVHVTDLVDALVRAAETTDANGVYHAAEPRVWTWDEAASLIIRAVGRGRIVRVPAVAVQTAAVLSETVARLAGRETIFNRDKARELLALAWICETEAAARDLGFRARIDLATGLAQTAAWYRSQGWLPRIRES